jgi:hypothetical protein
MQLPRDMAQMNAQELRDLATSLFAQVTQKDQELKHKQLKIDQLTHEMAVLKRWQFGRRSERPSRRSSRRRSCGHRSARARGLQAGLLCLRR